VQQLRQTRRRCCWSREPKESLLLAEFDEKVKMMISGFCCWKTAVSCVVWFLLSPYGCDMNLLV
jgi:hypothetical protein